MTRRLAKSAQALLCLLRSVSRRRRKRRGAHCHSTLSKSVVFYPADSMGSGELPMA